MFFAVDSLSVNTASFSSAIAFSSRPRESRRWGEPLVTITAGEFARTAAATDWVMSAERAGGDDTWIA